MGITIDEYHYEEIYPAFKAATDEKEKTARINAAFLNRLADAGLVVAARDAVAIADIGCGPCDTLVKYLTGVKFGPGFKIRATDYSPTYADERSGEALATLAAAQAAGTLKLVDFSAHAGDAFAGHLLELLGARNSPARPHEFQIVFASHVLYHCETPGSAERLIDDVVQNVLADDGICILYHLAKVPLTFQDFRARYGSSSAAAAHSNTPAVAIDDPPTKVAEVCTARRIPCLGMNFTADLRFAVPDEKIWNYFRDPGRYEQLCALHPEAAEDLKRLMFITQRAPNEFAADGSATGLGAYLDEIGDVLKRGSGILKLAESMQVIYRPGAPADFGQRIGAALSAAGIKGPAVAGRA
jgi:hypothetical protein